jgi:dCTP deaminase
MIINGTTLLHYEPIKDMLDHKVRGRITSHGLSEAGYDIRIKQDIAFRPVHDRMTVNGRPGRFTIASAVEEFDMPFDLVGVVHDKSTWARRGLSVFNTVLEPGWEGFLTLELVYHGNGELIIPAGSGIAQVLFHSTAKLAQYDGKYQHQPDHPVAAIDG